ncbi:follitropin subunit beta-like [Diceros bicornis minor]|uniref:follitropin subunit beta-like n=1 Tax=Diceros bicornis minor TaxID=77932 RepID=UPI0026EDC82C|nr:follitropin subunit beta-like [Diceros bicornis minor]
MPYAEGARAGWTEEEQRVEYSEEGQSQIPDLLLAAPKQNISRLGKKEKPEGPRRSGSSSSRTKPVQFCFLFCCWKAICCNSCALTNITIAVETEGCSFCRSISTTWCAGYCYTRNLVYKDPARPNTQKTCTFKELVYETVKVPGCAHRADSLYTYPVATICHCGRCDSDSTDCTVRGLGPSYCSFSDMKE